MLLLRKTSLKKLFSRYGEKRIFSLHKKGESQPGFLPSQGSADRPDATAGAISGSAGRDACEDDLPDEALNRNQQRERIRKVLETLPPEQYEVVHLSYIEGLSHSEIASTLGAPIGRVRSRMRLAYEKIRDAVEEEK